MKFLILVILMVSCEVHDLSEIGALVPPTVDQDRNLPQLDIEVSGRKRKIHLQTFGEPANPPIFVLHGGPGADFRLLLPLKALADKYYVIMWDSRGAGLSERVTKSELSIDSFNEEILQIKSKLCPDRKIILIGHSFGGNVLTRFTAAHPEQVERLILIDPGKLDTSLGPDSNGGAVNFLDGQDFFWQNEILTSSDHEAADYKAIDLLPKSARNWTCDGSIVYDYPFWRFGTYHYYIVQKNTRKLPKNFNWATGIESYDGPIDIITGSCGALGETFQCKTNLITLPSAGIYPIQGAGHLSLFTEFSDQTITVVKSLFI